MGILMLAKILFKEIQIMILEPIKASRLQQHLLDDSIITIIQTFNSNPAMI